MAAAIPPGADLSKIPLAPNPDGSPPNLVNPPSQSDLPLAVGLPLALISFCFVLLRLATNFKHVRKLGLDDYLCLFAWLMMTIYFALGVATRDTARHMYDIPLSFIDETYVKKSFAINFVVGPSLWSSKAAVLALYIRLFGPTKWLRWVSYATLLITFIFYWIQVPLTGVYCTPRGGEHWDMTVLLRCSRLSVMGPIQGAVGLAADCFILVLPLPVLYGLHIPGLRKVGLYVVFLMGILAIAASATSLYYRVKGYRQADKFWDSVKILACVYAECYTTIIVSCSPAVSSFWVNFFTKSAFYSSLRSSFNLFRSTPSRDKRESSPASYEIRKPRPEIPSNVIQRNDGYLELEDSALRGLRTEIFSVGPQMYEKDGIFTKTTIDQKVHNERRWE